MHLFSAHSDLGLLFTVKHISFIGSLFNQYQRELKRFIARKFGDADGAEDIVQDAFHNLLRVENIEQLDNPKAYLYRAASNLALNRLRQANYQADYLNQQSQEEPTTVTLDRELSAQDDLDRVQRALKSLPDKYRITFEMSRLQGKSYNEIALERGIAVSTVEKHIIKVLKFLRDELATELE